MPNVSVKTLQETVTFLSKRLEEGKLDKAVSLELLARGFEEKLAELYEQFQRGECSLDYMAEQLGVMTWDLYELLERRGMRTTNL
jgi:predicted HTH domain antitoxin